MILELQNQIPMDTPYGQAMAMFVIDQGNEQDLQWVTVITAGEHANEIWTWRNREVRMRANVTMGRPAIAAEDFIPVKGLRHSEEFTPGPFFARAPVPSEAKDWVGSKGK